MNGGTGTCIISRQLSLLEVVLLFTPGGGVEEWEVGHNRVHNLTRAKS